MSDADEQTRAKENRTPLRVLAVVFALCVLNFLAFVTGAAVIGGDAANGKVESGHYFVGSHGKFREVTPAVFEYSQWHTRSVWLTHPLAILAGFAMVLFGPRRNRT